MTKDEALKLALEALEWDYVGDKHQRKQEEAITAIKKALANVATNDTSKERVDEMKKQRHEQEPVAWSYWQSCLNDDDTQTAPWVHRLSKFKPTESIINKEVIPLYTTPPQSTWVGLTNNDLQPIAEEYRILFGSWVHDFARAIEAKLKEKNT